MRRKARTLLGAFVAAAALLPTAHSVGASPSGAPGRHPHFEDQGTLRWYPTWAEASAVARAEGRVVFMDMGRRACPGCQTLVERILPDPRVRQRLARAAVGWSVDADRREAFVDQLRARHLPGETLLPMIGFVRPDGAWITGSSGSVGLDAFLRQLARAEGHASPGAAAAGAPGAAAEGVASLPPPVLRRVAPGGGPSASPRAPQAAPARPTVPEPSRGPCAVPRPSVDDRISCCVVENPGYCCPPPACCPPPPCAPPPCTPPAAAPREREPDAPEPYAPTSVRTMATPTPAPRPLPEPVPEPVASAPPPRPRALPLPPPLPEFARALPPRMEPTAAPRAAAPRAQQIAPQAEQGLERALADALLGRRREAAQGLEQVRRAFAGTAAAEDAARGLAALATLDDLAQLSDPRGTLASALHANQREELKGTRWVRLFPAG